MGGAYCVTHAVSRSSNDSPARFGFIITKAVGNAVKRNLIRRRMKSVVERRLTQGFAGFDVVFRVLPTALSVSFAELEREMQRSLDLAAPPKHLAKNLP